MMLLRKISLLKLSLIILGLFIAIDPSIALAQVEDTIKQCPDNYMQNNRLFGPIMLCLTDVVQQVAQNFAQDISSALANAVVTVMAIAVAVMGIKVTIGASQRPAGESMLLLVKMCAVSYFALNMGALFFITLLQDFTNGLTDLFITLFDDNTTKTVTGNIRDPNDNSRAINVDVTPPGGNELWFKIDYIFQRTLGLGGDDTNLGDGSEFHKKGFIGIALLMIGLLTLGPVGSVVGIVSMFVMATIIAAFTMVIFSYIASLIALMILGAFAPMIIPLILFQPTRTIFDNWVKQVISYALQPLILTAFLIFIVQVMNAATVDTIRQYEDVWQDYISANMKNKQTMFEVMVQKKIQSQGQQKRRSGAEAHSVVGGLASGVGARIVAQREVSIEEGVTNLRLDVPFRTTNNDEIFEFTFNMVLTFLLGYILLSFVFELPKLVTELLGDRNITNIVQKFGGAAFGAVMRGQSGLSKTLRR